MTRVFTLSTSISTRWGNGSALVPTTSTPDRLRWRRTFIAGLLATASAIAGVNSPNMLCATSREIVPTIMSTPATFCTTAFSPVAPSLAPAFSIVDVARTFVPKTRISALLLRKARESFSTRSLPIPPPWPSITAIRVTFLISCISHGLISPVTRLSLIKNNRETANKKTTGKLCFGKV